MSYYGYIHCCNDVQIVKLQKGKYININMGCIYNGVCSSLVALFLWQQVTNIAAVMAHCYFTQNWVCFRILLCNLRKIWVSNMVIHLTGG